MTVEKLKQKILKFCKQGARGKDDVSTDRTNHAPLSTKKWENLSHTATLTRGKHKAFSGICFDAIRPRVIFFISDSLTMVHYYLMASSEQEKQH